MKQYRVAMKIISTGEWCFINRHGLRSTYKSKEEAIEHAEHSLKFESELKYPCFNEYKIMEREVSPWKNCE